jgi:hypothetical protein
MSVMLGETRSRGTVRVRAGMPAGRRWRFRFARGEECVEVDVVWALAGAWRGRDREGWVAVGLGPFVLGVRAEW